MGRSQLRGIAVALALSWAASDASAAEVLKYKNGDLVPGEVLSNELILGKSKIRIDETRLAGVHARSVADLRLVAKDLDRGIGHRG